MQDVKSHYDKLKIYGPYSTLAQHNKGGYKSQYIAAVFDEAILQYYLDSENEVVLDFGCAAGLLANKLSKFVGKVVGVDISPGMLELARAGSNIDGGAEYVLIDGMNLPLKSESFDSVITREVLVHVLDENISKIFDEISRVLLVGGKFYCLEQVSESFRWRTGSSPINLRRTTDEIQGIAKESGFRCVSAHVVRQPRFFWIYLFWFKILPKTIMKRFAKLEVLYNKFFVSIKTNRWHDVLFVFEKTSTTSF